MNTYYHSSTNTYVAYGESFSIEGTQYPGNWLTLASPAEILAAGFVEVLTVGEEKDPRYFYNSKVLDGQYLKVSSVPKDKEECIKTKWGEISTRRDTLMDSGGYSVPVLGVRKWFHSDQRSRSQQLGLVLLGDNLPKNLRWKTMDGSFVEMTTALASEILVSASNSDSRIFEVAESHRAALNVSASPETYDFSQGWPETF